MIKPLKKKRRPRTKNLYFTKVHEEAIVQYAKSDCIKEKTKLYVTLIQPAFDQMVDKIVYTYRFTTLPNIAYLKDDCKIWLTTILGKFDPDKGYKAFSYFSVVTKNWFIQEVKRTQKRNRTEVFMEDMKASTGTELQDEREKNYEEKRLEVEFWNSLTQEINTWESFMLKEKFSIRKLFIFT